jgi:DNA-binding response OmpR family regulator
MPKILVVEDDPTLLDALEYNLTRQEYEICTATDGIKALDSARRERPDLIMLDLMLPRMDGLEVCRILRQETIVPILILTARTEEMDRIVGLEVGGDDYVTKPFSMRELLSRVKALLRRSSYIQEELIAKGNASFPKTLTAQDLEIEQVRREVLHKGQPLHLKPKEYELLAFLMLNRGIALSRDLLLERVWGWDYDGGSRTVDVHVHWLRDKIEPNPSNPKRIVTVRGVGYRFEG